MGEKPVMSRVVRGGGMNGCAKSSLFAYLATRRRYNVKRESVCYMMSSSYSRHFLSKKLII